MRSAGNEITNANQAIERAIANLSFQGRGASSQDIVSHLRDLVEHIAVYSVHGDNPINGKYFDAITPALETLKARHSTRFIYDFHDLLQKVVSHYTPSEEISERLLLKYYENLLLLRSYASDRLGLAILGNLEQFPLDIDPGLSEYYGRIALKVDDFMLAHSSAIRQDRYYVRSAKPFFVNGMVYYETTLVPAYDSSSKFDHIIVFSSFKMATNYSVLISTKHCSIKGLGRSLPIIVVDDYRVSVRPCELNKLSRVLGLNGSAKVSGKLRSYRSLMEFMTSSGMTLDEIASLDEPEFEQLVSQIEYSGNDCPVHALLIAAHQFLADGKPGCNVLRYLLSKPRNRVIEDQFEDAANGNLGGLYLKNGCIPFDKQPYCTNLIRHEVSVVDLFSCIDPDDYEDNHIARLISRFARDNGVIYVDESEASDYQNLDELINSYNLRLYSGHTSRRIVHEMGQLFIKGDEEDVSFALQELLRLSEKGVGGYRAMCEAWLAENPLRVDDPLKQNALLSMFADSKVAFIFGSAGTGKTTMVDIICEALRGVSKRAIANTNPAVDSLRRRVKDPECEFQTIAKYLHYPQECDLLIIDECSTVSNRDIHQIVGFGKFKLLLLVGDVRQIEAIRLGNWFELAREFIPSRCVFEFEEPWRASSEDLSRLWSSVRGNEPDIAEILESCNMSSLLDETIFQPILSDEIVLCLNYDGLYGINNVNRLLQASNPNKPMSWDLHTYKVGDPILFNETNRFYPLLYNNLKGKILAIDRSQEGVLTFEVAIERSLSEIQVSAYKELEYIDVSNGQTRIRFSVFENHDPEGEEQDASHIVPFQVAYAVSIHKAQGLEYDSVKIIVTKDVEKRISHNIFYTAITRARRSLKIYWSPESQNAVLSGFNLSECRKDAQLISKRFGLALHPTN